MPNKKPLVLELNNIDILGHKFNGYDLYTHFRKNQKNLNIDMLVNNRLSYYSKAHYLFRSGYTEECDWAVQAAEKKFLSTKNQVSLAEEALKDNSLYQKADVLHFHLYHNMNLPIEFLLRIPDTKKIILDIHDTFWLSDKNIPMLEVFDYTNLNEKSLFLQRQRVLNNLDAYFVVHSPYMLNQFKKSLSTNTIKNVHLIPFGIDLSIFKPLPKSEIKKIKSKMGIPPNNIVLFCRAQQEFKGLNYIKEALKLLSPTYPISIITVSNKNLLDELRDKYQIIDMGTVYSEQQMAKLFNVCDIFLSPSTEESFGFMAAEAMACSKPVIVFDGTALPHTTNAPKIGISTKRDAKSLKNAIEKLINNPEERLKRGKLGLTFVHKNYNENTYYREYLHLFETVIKTPRKKYSIPQLASSHSNDRILKSLQKALSLIKKEVVEQKPIQTENYKSPVIDYDDPIIQKELNTFNIELYNIISNGHRLRHIICTTRRFIPKPIKKIINTVERIIIAGPRKLHHLIRRNKR